MAITQKTWTSSLNNALNGADQRVQYREVFFALYRALADNGWIREWTCDGVTASSADNLPNAAAVTIGLNTTQPISYFVMRAPANFVRGGGTVRILVATNESNVDTTPQNCIVRISRGAYDLHGTPLQNIPVARVAERAVVGTPLLLPNAGLTASSYHLWTTSVGDVIIGVKPNTIAQMRMLMVITAPTTSIDNYSIGPLAATVFFSGAAAASAISATSLRTAGNWGHLNPDGTAGVNTTSWSPLYDGASGWVGGVDSVGEVPFVPVSVYSSGGSSFEDGRDLGYLVDIWSVPSLLPIGDTDTNDADAMRITSIGGGLALPTTFAQLPFN